MKLYVDLETLQLIEGPGFRNPITSLRFKRGDSARLEVSFLEGGSTAVAIGDPVTLEIRFGIKPRNRYDVGYLVHDAVWTMPAEDADNPAYQSSPSFNTVELDSALGVGSSTGSELAEITLMGEITWREGAGEPTSTRTFLVVVENDVNRGTEGVPESATPAYPAPENLVTAANIGDNAVRHDAAQSLNPTQQAQARANIGVLAFPPNDGISYGMTNETWAAITGLTSYLSNPSIDLNTALSSLSTTTNWILSLSDGKWLLPAGFTSESDAILLEQSPSASIELFNGIATTLSGQSVYHPISLPPGNYHIELEVVETGSNPSDWLRLYVTLGAYGYSTMSNFQSSSFIAYNPYYGDQTSGVGYFEMAPDFTPKTASFDINIGIQAAQQQIEAYISTAVYQPHLIVTATPI